MHIKSLGDHTGDLLRLAKDAADTTAGVFARSDGPYGRLSLNYWQYRYW